MFKYWMELVFATCAVAGTVCLTYIWWAAYLNNWHIDVQINNFGEGWAELVMLHVMLVTGAILIVRELRRMSRRRKE